MAARTLLQLRTDIRQRADQEDSQFVSDSELTSYINQSYHELHDLLVKTVEDYFILKEEFIISVGNTFDLTTLTSSFYKLRGLDKNIDGKFIEIHPVPFGERNYSSVPIFRQFVGPDVAYRILGNLLYIFPEDWAQNVYKIWYVPRVTELIQDSDALEINCNEYREYIVADCAAKLLAKEESDPSVQLGQRESTIKRIAELASDRDQGEPERVTDVRRNNYEY